MRHDPDVRTEETAAPRPGFLVVEWSEPWQDYTIHPYFILGAAFPPQPSSSCPGPSLQSLSVPVIPLKTVIPPSHRKTESPILHTEKTAPIKEKAVPASISASTLLPSLFPMNSPSHYYYLSLFLLIPKWSLVDKLLFLFSIQFLLL
jgi:hypothetical protein